MKISYADLHTNDIADTSVLLRYYYVMISILAYLLVRGYLYWPEAKPNVNTATQGLITRPIQKSSRNDIFIN
jgi:hypothetical protein